MGLPSQLTELRQQLAEVSQSMGERGRQYDERLNTLQEALRLLSQDVTFLLNAVHASSSQTKGRKIEWFGEHPREGLGLLWALSVILSRQGYVQRASDGFAILRSAGDQYLLKLYAYRGKLGQTPIELPWAILAT
ncbi:hypothetical protein PENPOL_c035G03157 [Penicillium polonicum]|uniref:Uncharacterized protein n=1 Tax=Penicillium polonicum TaxID=60169 RepID=A0A1V6N5I4_PENPO|nr:hypothetical protein PENPOL_c035G03157 [Penicillium polonicum]